jgi:hypothetical protein
MVPVPGGDLAAEELAYARGYGRDAGEEGRLKCASLRPRE